MWYLVYATSPLNLVVVGKLGRSRVTLRNLPLPDLVVTLCIQLWFVLVSMGVTASVVPVRLVMWLAPAVLPVMLKTPLIELQVSLSMESVPTATYTGHLLLPMRVNMTHPLLTTSCSLAFLRQM